MTRQRASGRRLLLEMVIGVLALAIAGSATGLLVFLRGGGTQPEDVLPSGALAFARIDLDPSAGQKLAVYDIARDFPGASVRATDTLKDDLLGALLSATGIDYDRDVGPWLGERAGVAVLPGAVPTYVAALTYTDAAKARDGLSRVSGTAFGFVPDEDYVLLGPTQAVVDAALRADEHLSDDEAYADAVDSLDGDQIAVAWGDVRRILSALPGGVTGQVERLLGAGLRGTVVLGVRADRGALEVQGRVTGLPESTNLLFAGSTPGSVLAGRLPDDVAVAVSATELGATLERAFDQLVGFGPGLVLRARAATVGLALPRDLVGLLGQETAVAVYDRDRLGARTTGGDAALAGRALALLGGSPALVRTTPDGVVAALDAGTLQALSSGRPELGQQPQFRRAVPDAEGAGLVVYADLRKVVALAGGSRDDLALLGTARALGLTVDTEGGVQRLRLRVVFD